MPPTEHCQDHVVHARVTFSDSGRPARVRVAVADADHLLPGPLGEGLTDEDGRARVQFSAAPYRDRFARDPDVYLMVYDAQGSLLTSTLDATLRGGGRVRKIHVQLSEEHASLPGILNILAGDGGGAGGVKSLDPHPHLHPGGSETAQEEAATRVLAELFGSDEAVTTPFPCGTPMIRRGGARSLGQKSTQEALAADDPTLTAPPFASPPFLLRYATSGVSAVRDVPSSSITLPGSDTVVGATTPGAVPGYVQRVAFWLHYALERFTGPTYGFRAPFPGRTIEVKINRGATNLAHAGVIMLGCSYSEDLVACIAVHELMHLVQEEYEGKGREGSWSKGREGGAVLAEDYVLDPLNRYGLEADRAAGTLAAPHHSLEAQGYKQALFLKYMSEQKASRGENGSRVEAYRVLLESFDAVGYTTEAVERAVSQLDPNQTLCSLRCLDADGLDEVCSETLLGNFWLACYLKELGRNVPDPRFDFAEDDEPGGFDVMLKADAKRRTLGHVTLEVSDTLEAGQSLTLSSGDGGEVPAFGARFYKVALAGGVSALRVEFIAGEGFTRPLVQVVELEPGRTVRDILRCDRTRWSRTIPGARSGTQLDHVLIVVSGTVSGGRFTLNVSDAAAAPDVMVTRWNRLPGTHYEMDPVQGWTWASPDLWVEGGEGGGGPEVVMGADNRLFVRLHNRGSLPAHDIQVDLWYQEGAEPADQAWRRVQDRAQRDQVLTGLALAAESSGEWHVDWAPVAAPGGVGEVTVRAVVTVPGDPNIDNKRCMSRIRLAGASNG